VASAHGVDLSAVSGDGDRALVGWRLPLLDALPDTCIHVVPIQHRRVWEL
jgi:hypothetical protein